MSPKEKAEELIHKMYVVHSNSASDITLHFAKQCAIIAVDEILKNVYDDHATIGRQSLTDKEYWQQVKQEIETL